MEITLTEFVDFTLESGTAQVDLVRQVKQRAASGYDPAADFYKGLREEIVELHKSGRMSASAIDGWLARQTNPKRIPAYAARVGGYKAFMVGKTLSWFQPPRGRWVDGDLEVKVNPELGLAIDGERTVVKLYLKAKPPTVTRTQAIFALLEEELRSKLAASTKFAILDVGSAKLLAPSPKWSPSDMKALLKGEAAMFRSLWASV